MTIAVWVASSDIHWDKHLSHTNASRAVAHPTEIWVGRTLERYSNCPIKVKCVISAAPITHLTSPDLVDSQQDYLAVCLDPDTTSCCLTWVMLTQGCGSWVLVQDLCRHRRTQRTETTRLNYLRACTLESSKQHLLSPKTQSRHTSLTFCDE